MAKDPRRCPCHPADNPLAAAGGGGGGVCPSCLHDRLRLLCPDCAHVRPCPCNSSPSFSSSSPDLAASRRQGSASVCGRGRRPPARKEEAEKGNVRKSRLVGVAGDGNAGGLKWLHRFFLVAARAFGVDGRRRPRSASSDRTPPTLR